MKLWATFIWGSLFCFTLTGKSLSVGHSLLLRDSLFTSIDSSVVIKQLELDSSLTSLSSAILTFYRKRHFDYVWFTPKGLNEPARSFKNMLQKYNQAGIMQYGILWPSVKEGIRKFENGTVDTNKLDSSRLALELQLTGNFCQFIHSNFLANKSIAEEWYMPSDTLSIDSAVKRVYSQEYSLDSILFSKQIIQLTNQLRKYEKLRQNHSWSVITLPGKAYKVGDKNSVLKAIKQRIAVLTDSTYTDTSSVFTPQLKSMVLRMQKNAGIAYDGIIGREFMELINISPVDRIMQILVNIQRLKWMPDINYNENVIVNIPEFAMHVFQVGRALLEQCGSCW